MNEIRKIYGAYNTGVNFGWCAYKTTYIEFNKDTLMLESVKYGKINTKCVAQHYSNIIVHWIEYDV